MKKLLILTSLALLLNNYASAITMKNSANSTVVTNNTSDNTSTVKSWMKPKNGRVSVFDTALHVAIINNKTYNLNSDIKVYDGTPVKGSRIKFNTNEKNNITDVWVMKK